MSFLLFKALKFVGVMIVVAMVFVAIIGEKDTRSLGNTTAEVGASAADIVVTDMIPTFFSGFKSDNPPAKNPTKAPKKCVPSATVNC